MTDPLKQMIQGIEQQVAEKYTGKQYTDSYVAFLDILGMKELIKRPYEDLRLIFNAAETAREFYSGITVSGGPRFISQNHLKMTIMSDALVLSIDSQIDDSFSKLVGFSSSLISKVLKALDIPVFLRGGISRGLIFQDSTTVFGPGLVEAYTLENETAKNMRCVVSRDLEQDSSVQRYLSGKGSALVTDPEDGLRFIGFARAENRDHLLEFASEILDSDDKECVKDKYRWLIKYVESQTEP